MAKNNFYGVKVGLVSGVYDNWPACQENVKGVPGAIYKGFPTEEEARNFVGDNSKQIIAPTPVIELSIIEGRSPSVQAAFDLFSEEPNRKAADLVFIKLMNDGVTYDCPDGRDDVVEAIMEEYHRSDVSIGELLDSTSIVGLSVNDCVYVYSCLYLKIESDQTVRHLSEGGFVILSKNN